VNIYDSSFFEKYQIFSPTAEGFLNEKASDHTAYLGKVIFVQGRNAGTSTALFCLLQCDFLNPPEIKNLIGSVLYSERKDHSAENAFSNIFRHGRDTE
jgi:hypothetical protein